MRAIVTTAAVVMLASTIQIDPVSIGSVHAQDRVTTVLADLLKALGGEGKVAGLKALTAEGPFRRVMGGRGMEGTLTLTLVRPDKLRRVEEIAMGGMVGGPTIERTSVLNGTTAWEETATSGMGAGMQMMHGGGGTPRGGGCPTPEQQALREAMHGPDGAPGAGTISRATPEQLHEVRVRRMKVQMQRWLAALVAAAPQPWTDAGVVESPDGKADILETKEDTGRVLRLFVDQLTHLPLIVQYQDPKPMAMINSPGGAGRGTGESPALGTYAMHLGDYKKVDGMMLPHRIEISIDGQPNEEWTIEKYKVNPTVKAHTWEKK